MLVSWEAAASCCPKSVDDRLCLFAYSSPVTPFIFDPDANMPRPSRSLADSIKDITACYMAVVEHRNGCNECNEV
jgi:hypothetical protein